MKPNLTYCAQEVYTHDRDHFYQCLMVPAVHREAFFCLYALNLELARVPGLVSEEMIGHIRYAWWAEAVEGLALEGNAKGHPVLEALKTAGLPQEPMAQLISHYREHYPDHLGDNDHLIDPVALKLLQALCPEAEKTWLKTSRLIHRHRSRFGAGANGWLAFKLLIYNL